jgi:hypothetical protein
MEKLLKLIITLLEKYAVPVICVVCLVLYVKFGDTFNKIFGWGSKEEEKKEELKQHDQALVLDTKKVTPEMSKAQQAKTTADNAAAANKFFQARAAEKLKPVLAVWTTLSLIGTRQKEMMSIAAYMKQHKISLSGTAVEYKKLTGYDMYEDARKVMSDDYMKWLGAAGTVK